MELVIVQDNTPVVSHRVIAENTGNQAKHLFELISKHKSDFEQFGHLPFETETVTNSARAINKSKTYYLNEQQSTLLLTYLRNSEIVRKFKVALVKEFYELRDKNTVPYTMLYSKERECIELKRAMSRLLKQPTTTCEELLKLHYPVLHNNILELDNNFKNIDIAALQRFVFLISQIQKNINTLAQGLKQDRKKRN